MDELESEWENKESSTWKSSWMMRLGRKLLVTGIVMSSAPLVIPSVMVVSAIGFVCSVPYGVLFVTYACTKTLMSRLLPIPSPSARLLLEYDKGFNGEEEGELIEGRVEFVDKGNEDWDKGDILQKGVYEEYGVENDEKGSVEQVGEIVEEDYGELMNERTSGSFEEVEKIDGLQVEQPIVEEIRNEQPADEGYGIEPVVEGGSDIKKETPVGFENVEEEVVRETSQSVENVDAPKKRRKKKKGKGERSVKGSENEQQGDKKGRDNETKQKTAELKNVAVDVENDELVRNLRESFKRNGKEGTSNTAECKQGGEKEQVDAEVIKSKGDEGKKQRKREQRLIEESLAKRPVDDKVIGALVGLEGSEKKDKERCLIEESLAQQPVDDKVIGALGGLAGSEKKDKERRLIEESSAKQPLDDKVIGALVGLEKIKKKNKETPLNVSISEQPIEEVCNIVVEFEGDEKNGTNMENKTPFQVEKVDVHLSQSTDIEEDKELVKETRGLLEKIRDEGKTGYVDDKPSTEKGLDMKENSSTVSLQGSSPEVNTEESWPSLSYSVHQEASDSSELPLSIKALEADDIRSSTDNVIDAASDEAIPCEERIWEQMNALRTIVGYKAARKETCIEELKALYLFTGIEPPASLKDTSCDLAEVDAKLGFLKSVVGVK